MEISNFDFILLFGSYLGILLLILGSASEMPFLSKRHHSNTPILLEVSFQARPDSSEVVRQKNMFNRDMPNPDRLRSSSGPALLPGRARRSVWKIKLIHNQ
jgi:hypothetical protein